MVRAVCPPAHQAGSTARVAADQLGHAHVSMTQNTYFARKIVDTGAAKVLNVLQFTAAN
ncbi:hypothetical protein GCM10010436_34850 [Paractinoplanes durhamensis]